MDLDNGCNITMLTSYSYYLVGEDSLFHSRLLTFIEVLFCCEGKNTAHHLAL